MNARFSALIATLFLLSSCHGAMSSKQDAKKSEQEESMGQIDQSSRNFEVVNNESEANAINRQTEAAIEEVEVADRVFFNYDSFELSDAAGKILDTQASWLKSDPSIKIIIEGHCDERGTREYNIALGEKRALAVKRYLSQNGVDSSRIKIISYGKERPAFLGSTEEIFSKNRRAVTVIAE